MWRQMCGEVTTQCLTPDFSKLWFSDVRISLMLNRSSHVKSVEHKLIEVVGSG